MKLNEIRVPPGLTLTLTMMLGELPYDDPDRERVFNAMRITLHEGETWIGSMEIRRDYLDREDAHEAIQMLIDARARPRVVEEETKPKLVLTPPPSNERTAMHDILIYCPECGALPMTEVRTGAQRESRYFVTDQQLEHYKRELATYACVKCGGPMALKEFSPIRLVADDEAST
jgi:hypothetical protein